MARSLFAEPAIGDDGISVDAAVAEKRPIPASLFALGRIALDNENFFLVVGGFRKNLAERIGDERIAPKFDARIALVRLAFKADAIDDGYIGAIGDGVGTLNGFPGIQLSGADLRFLVRVPADTGGIKNNLRALERGDAGTFGVPLVPTDLHANAGEFGVEVEKAEIAGREIKFFVVERVVGNVHLAIFAEVGAVGIENGAGVVVDAGGAAFENGNDESDFFFFSDLREAVGGGAGNGFSEIKEFGIFGAARRMNRTGAGAFGGWTSSMRASSSVRFPFWWLHGAHAVTTFSQMDSPPRDRGMTWSSVSRPAVVPQ